jgi:hypothetical protein
LTRVYACVARRAKLSTKVLAMMKFMVRYRESALSLGIMDRYQYIVAGEGQWVRRC